MAPGRVVVGGLAHPIGHSPRVTLGGTPDNDFVVNHPLVSRHHLELHWRGSCWVIVDAGSTNGFFLGGQRMHEVPVTGPLRVLLGDASTGPVVDVALGGLPEHQPPDARIPVVPPSLRDAPHLQSLHHHIAELPSTDPPSTGRPAPGRDAIALAGHQTIGRTPDNDIVINDVLASRRHARLVTGPQGLVIEDLGSVNGTYVNGQRISTQVLGEGAVVTIGNSDLVVSGGRLIRGRAPNVVAGGLHVGGVGLVVDDKQLLVNVEFSAGPGSLTAIIGPSGAGKSTVSKIIAGLSNPTSGVVTFEGRGVHAEYEALRTRIGMVPQDDVLHRQLTLRQALHYAAELRLPPDLTRDDQDRVIAGVLGELQLLEHLDTRVDKLSGGQRKRASVAMELLTGPSLLILDEPTSGLDPALDRQVMSTLRRLADAGRVVLVVTHSLTYLSMCDQVLLLAPGGKTAYCGAPAAVGAAMGTADWAEIFAFVAEQPDVAHQRYLAHHRRRPPPAPAWRVGPPVRPPQSGFGRQAGTIARRQIRLTLADTGYLVFLAVMPIVLGLLSLVIPGSAGFGPNAPDSAGETVQVLVVLVIGASFMGIALTARDLVGERPIYERERAVGLRPASYLFAKIAVFFVVATLQSVVMVAITYIGRGVPSAGVLLPGWFELFITIAVLACVSTLIGLTISSLVRSNEQIMPPLVLVVMVQLVFCGGLFPLAGRVGLEQLSWLFPARWGYAAAASTVDLRTISPHSPSVRDESLWDHTLANLALSYLVLLVIGVILIAITYSRLVLRRSR